MAHASTVSDAIVRAWPNVIKMLAGRKYSVKDLPCSVDETYVQGVLAKQRYTLTVERKKPPRFIPEHPNEVPTADPALPTTEKAYIVFHQEPAPVGVKFVRTVVDSMRQEGIPKALIVSLAGATAFTNTALREMREDGQSVEVWLYRAFYFCLAEHELTKNHWLMTPAQTRLLLEQLSIQANMLPKCQEAEPLRRYYDMQHGDVIGNWECNGYQERTPNYRIYLEESSNPASGVAESMGGE